MFQFVDKCSLIISTPSVSNFQASVEVSSYSNIVIWVPFSLFYLLIMIFVSNWQRSRITITVLWRARMYEHLGNQRLANLPTCSYKYVYVILCIQSCPIIRGINIQSSTVLLLIRCFPRCQDPDGGRGEPAALFHRGRHRGHLPHSSQGGLQHGGRVQAGATTKLSSVFRGSLS